MEQYSRIGLTIEKYAVDLVSSLLTLRLRRRNPRVLLAFLILCLKCVNTDAVYVKESDTRDRRRK